MHLTQAPPYLSLEGPAQRGFNEVPLRGLAALYQSGDGEGLLPKTHYYGLTAEEEPRVTA
ncbi:MAG: hypothetical protein ACPHF4_06680 [Rubripirellula sp.]